MMLIVEKHPNQVYIYFESDTFFIRHFRYFCGTIWHLQSRSQHSQLYF